MDLPKRGPKRTNFERENDLYRTTQLYLKGKTQAEIAEELEVSREQIKYDIAIIQKRWRESGLIDMNESKQKELARIDTLERTYWEAWERTLEEKTKTRTEQSTSGKGDKDAGKTAKATIEKETLLGNPAYLSGVQWCISERCKILGIYAPAKVAPTNPEGDKPYDGSVSDEQRITRLAAILNTARDRRDRQPVGDGPSDLASIAGTTD